MKELSIEEKAKRYDKVVEKAKIKKEESRNLGLLEFIDENFPELKESEEEMIRKELIEYIRKTTCVNFIGKCSKKEAERFIFWLEKQGEHKPTDKVVPKFKVGDKVKSFIDGFECTIESIDNTCYYGDTTNFDIQDQDGWELVEQKPAWSEEDEDMLYKVTAILNRLCAKGEEFIWSPKTLEKLFYWLQNLKPQSHWKPSDRELGAILVAIGDEKQKGSDVAKELRNIYQQLKELKG